MRFASDSLEYLKLTVTNVPDGAPVYFKIGTAPWTLATEVVGTVAQYQVRIVGPDYDGSVDATGAIPITADRTPVRVRVEADPEAPTFPAPDVLELVSA